MYLLKENRKSIFMISQFFSFHFLLSSSPSPLNNLKWIRYEQHYLYFVCEYAIYKNHPAFLRFRTKGLCVKVISYMLGVGWVRREVKKKREIFILVFVCGKE